MSRAERNSVSRKKREGRTQDRNQPRVTRDVNPRGWEADDCPADLAEQLWQTVAAEESSPPTSHFQRLLAAGVELPEPVHLPDGQVTVKLWEVIRALAGLQVFLTNTNHLSDRELYARLWHDTLRELAEDLPPEMGFACCLDLVSSGSQADIHFYLKHYANEEWRQRWAADFPRDRIPPHEEPPHDRDRHLPREEW